MADDEPSYIDYEAFLDPSFSTTAFANSLVLATNNPSDTPLDLSTPLSRILFDVQEIDTHIDTLTTKSALPLLEYTKDRAKSGERILQEVEAQVASLTEGYKTLEKEVIERYEAAEQVRLAAERLCQTVKIGRAVARCLMLGRQLEVQLAEVGGSGTGNTRREDHRAMVRSSNTLMSLRQVLLASRVGEEGEGLERIHVITTLKSDLLGPAERNLISRSQQMIREFSMSSLLTSNGLSQQPSAASTYAQTEETKSRTTSALLTLYLLSPAMRNATTATFEPALLTSALQDYLQTALKSSLAALARALATLPTLERTLLEISARCQNIVALETLLESVKPPPHPLVSNSASEHVEGQRSASRLPPQNLLQPLLYSLDTSSLPSYFWRSLASALSPRVQEILNRGGVSARTLRSNRDRVRDAVRECVNRGSQLPASALSRGKGAATGNWEREAAVMVGSIIGVLGRAATGLSALTARIYLCSEPCAALSLWAIVSHRSLPHLLLLRRRRALPFFHPRPDLTFSSCTLLVERPAFCASQAEAPSAASRNRLALEKTHASFTSPDATFEAPLRPVDLRDSLVRSTNSPRSLRTRARLDLLRTNPPPPQNMSVSQIAGNRNSTPEASSSSLRPPSSRAIGANHHLRASADMGVFASSPLSNRGIRPSSEVYFNKQGSQDEDAMDKAAQQWIADIDQYEITLEEMAAATLDQDFKDELSAIEQWFRVLSEPERTAALYQLLQQTTGVQQRFFIQVLQQMAKSHPMSSVLSPANFGEKDPMSQKLNDAMNKLSVEGSRNSVGLGRPPPSPGAKRNSGLDSNTINSMFPDAAAAIAKQKAEFTQHTGAAPTSNRNSAVGDRSSMIAPTISAPDDGKRDNAPQPPSSPWGPRSGENQQPQRPKSSSSHQQPMGQFVQPPPSAGGLRSPRPMTLSGDQNIQSTTLNAPDHSGAGMPMLSPYGGASGSWASMVNTPLAANFQQQSTQADMVANATAMKLAALSTVNNRIQLDDVRKYRRARSSEGQGSGHNNMPQQNMPASVVMTNEFGQVLTPQQAAALQAQQLAAMNGRRSRPSSPGIAMQGGNINAMNFASPQNNGFLTAYDNSMAGLNLGQFGMGMGGSHEGYLSDHSEINRGRSPRGRRGSSKPPEDPTNPDLLQDIPAWLRSLRLHKYTDNLKDLKWSELVELDDEGLEKRGVNALGARRKMLKVFEQVKDAKAEGKLPPS